MVRELCSGWLWLCLSVIPAFELMPAIEPKDRVIIVRTGLRPG